MEPDEKELETDSKKESTEKPSKEPEAIKDDWEIKAKEYKEGWQRAQADLINYRKRSDEEKQAFAKYAHADLILQILPVLDNFKRAAEHTPKANDEANWTNWASGVKAVEKQFEMILQNNGITEIPAKVGDTFDPNHHDAIASEESKEPTDTILQVIEPGYTLNGRVLRATKVKVATEKK